MMFDYIDPKPLEFWVVLVDETLFATEMKWKFEEPNDD